MSEQPGAFSLYEATTRELLNRIGQDHPYYANALMYQRRLQANIQHSQSEGDTDELKTARCRIINELNKLAMCTQGLSFGELYVQIESQKEQQAQYLPNISDPLRLAKLDPEGTVLPLLKAVVRAVAIRDPFVGSAEDAVGFFFGRVFLARLARGFRGQFEVGHFPIRVGVGLHVVEELSRQRPAIVLRRPLTGGCRLACGGRLPDLLHPT